MVPDGVDSIPALKDVYIVGIKYVYKEHKNLATNLKKKKINITST